MRFHAIQNVETALRFLRYKEIKLVNIRGEDIVDGNPKLTLGLIWTIILHFQVRTRKFLPFRLVKFLSSRTLDPRTGLSLTHHSFKGSQINYDYRILLCFMYLHACTRI